MRKIIALVTGVAAVLLCAALLVIMDGVEPGQAAPMPIPTPVSVNASGTTPRYASFFTAEAVTADTTSTCVEVSAFNKADIYYNVTIDGANVNTTTLTLQHGNSDTALTDGVALQAATAVSVTNMQQVQIFGGYLCVKIDTTDTSTGTVTVTANALVK